MADKKPVEVPQTTGGTEKGQDPSEEEKRTSKDTTGTTGTDESGSGSTPKETPQQGHDAGGGIMGIFPKIPGLPQIGGHRAWGKWAPPPPKPEGEESLHEVVEKLRAKETSPARSKKAKPEKIVEEPEQAPKRKEPAPPKPEKAKRDPTKKKRKVTVYNVREPKAKPDEIQEEPEPKELPPPPKPEPVVIQPEPVKKPVPPPPPPAQELPPPPPKPEPKEIPQAPKELPPPPPPPKAQLQEVKQEPVQQPVPKELPPPPPKPEPEEIKKPMTKELPYNLDVQSLIPSHMVKSVKIKKVKKTEAIRKHVAPPRDDDKPTGPVASKVVFLKRPDEPPKATEEPPPEPVVEPMPEPEPAPEVPKGVIQPEGITDINGLPMFLVTDTVANLIHITNEDKLIDKRLSELIDVHRGDMLKKLKKKQQTKIPTYTYAEMMKMLKDQGIPCPTNEDFSRLHGLHSRWDPDFTVLEYFSPMLRTFVPINMRSAKNIAVSPLLRVNGINAKLEIIKYRGRYRGCWTTDDCIKGLDISKVPPKREALEGFVQRGRHENTQKKYDEMSKVALDEAHLDYLIEIQSYQAETLPIPIFYDMLHLGMEVANENLRILVEEDGYPPNDIIFISTEEHAQQLKRKIQLYGALGLETLESKRKGLGQYLPQWLQTRDEVVREIMNRKDNEWYTRLTKTENEGKVRENIRKGEDPRKSIGTSKIRASFSKDARKVHPETHAPGDNKGHLKHKK
ncbi:hypothetical protein Ocin01_09166, partial [Orchesella cincta]